MSPSTGAFNMRQLLIVFLSVVTPFAHASEVVCGYCILRNEVSVFEHSYGLTYEHDKIILNLAKGLSTKDFRTKTNHVCTGPVTEVLSAEGRKKAYEVYPKEGTSDYGTPIYVSHLRICDGALVPLDEYRLKPFKDFGHVLVSGERKEFLERLNAMAKNLEPDKVEAMVRKLLEEKDGPLAKQRAALVTETTDSVVKLISTTQPKKK
jgi:hypothetical protein